MNWEDLPLSEQHRELIAGSGISPEVAAARGYRTVEVRADLRRLGFSDTQARVPALFIPVHGVTGEVVLYQIRPDEPRIVDGKPVKYETPRGSRMVLDVPPAAGGRIGDPSVPLFITEGARKADAAVSRGLCCIDLLGVWNWRGANEHDGKTALADWESVALNDRKVYVVFDSDVIEKAQVQKAVFRLMHFLQSRGATVSVIRLPSGEGGSKVGLDDYFATGKSVDDLLALVSDSSDADGEMSRGSEVGEIAPIYAGQADLHETVMRAWDAVVRFNTPPKMFLFGSFEVVRISTAQNAEPVIGHLGPDGMRLVLARSSKWFLLDSNGNLKDAKPPTDVARAMLADDLCPLPVLDRIIRAPIVAPDGELVMTEGYHPRTRVYYFPGHLEIPAVSTSPSHEEIQVAKQMILEDLLVDFPFVSQADQANAVALFELPFIRELIDGPTPIHLIEKPTPGTGAGLLADVISLSTRGGNCPLMTEGREEEEWRKRITAALMASPEVLLIDNLRHRLDSAALSAAVTAKVWSDRKLGQSLVVSLPVRCAWIVTGNNPAVSSEIARRCVSIRMDAKVDRPWHRPTESFKHPELRLWAAENRGRLIWAALTLARAWFAAGCPRSSTTLGGFEEWSKVMGGILQVAGIEGFLENRQKFYDRADREGEQWRTLISVWWGRFGGDEVGTKELFGLISEDEIPFELGKGTERSQKTRLGVELARSVDRRFNLGDIILKIEGSDPFRNAARWRLVNLDNVVNVAGRLTNASAREGVSVISSEANIGSGKCQKGSQGSHAELFSPDPHTPRVAGDLGWKGSQGYQGSHEGSEDSLDDMPEGSVEESPDAADREVGEL
ncbi:MAG: DUF3854 domain-containing protein [Planctomycetes bacterium]|nr:DUF3854 domain-containing protein [Planctomycetota bacterium]